MKQRTAIDELKHKLDVAIRSNSKDIRFSRDDIIKYNIALSDFLREHYELKSQTQELVIQTLTTLREQDNAE